jgi:hypothetical protein
VTPPQQALDWILDNYQSVDEIWRCGQKIFYIIDPKVGHLAIFVGTKVAAKDHAEFINNMELIDAMPPGLYEIRITEKPATREAPPFELCIEARGLDDIRALGCNSVEDEREFAAVARVSELNNAAYQTFVQPWIKMIDSPQLARAVLELNPLRLSYPLLSDKNPMMRGVAWLAEQARANRVVAAADNPFIAMQQQFSQAMIYALNFYRDVRDLTVEQTFHAMYGSLLVQAACGIAQNGGQPRPRPGLSPSILATIDEEIRRLRGRIGQGGPLDAAARVLVYIGKARHRIEDRTFEALRKLLLAHPEVSPADFKEILREQWAIVTIDERAAIEALPRLLPTDGAARHAFLDAIETIVATTGDLNADTQRRLSKIKLLFDSDSLRLAPPQGMGQITAPSTASQIQAVPRTN